MNTRPTIGRARRRAAVALVTLVTLAAALPGAAIAAPPGELDGARRDAVIERLQELLRERYVFPEKAEAMAGALARHRDAGEYDSIANGPAFAERLTGDLHAVCPDKHLRVRYGAEPTPLADPDGEPSPAELDAERRRAARRNFAFDRVERLPGNVGYLKFDGFLPPELAAETATAAMTFLAHTDAILIDMRDNGGGSPEMVRWISSYLFGDEPVHLNSLYFRPADETREFWTDPSVPGTRNPDALVYVLTSAYTFSAAEEFTYNLQARGRATIVGETTGGGAHPGGTVRIDDQFAVWVPEGRAINPVTGTNWEGTGVAPDLECERWAALHEAYIDALAALRSRPGAESDPELRDALRDANRAYADEEIEREG